MSLKSILSTVFFICSYLLTLMPLSAQQEQGEIIIISERVGKEIDPEERDKFKLFQGIKGFQSAVYIKLPDGRYFLKITYLDEKIGEIKISRIQQSELSIKIRGDYIDRFEEIQARKVEEERTGEIQAHQDSTYQEPGTAFYLELGGKVFGSINVDFPIKKSNRITVGLLGIFPSFMYFYLPGDKNSRLELGCGFSYIWLGPGGSGKPEAPLICHGVFGYRYQKKERAFVSSRFYSIAYFS